MLQALSAAGWAGGCGAGQAGPRGRSDASEFGAAMPWFPVKKVRKQMKLLLLLLLLTCAAWLTYVHRSLVRPGRALRQRLGYGRGTRGRAALRAGASQGAGGLTAQSPRRPAPPSSAVLGEGSRLCSTGRPVTSAVTLDTFGAHP